MKLNELIAKIDILLKEKTGSRLSYLEKAVLEGEWKGMTYEDMAESLGKSLSYIKGNIGASLWKRLSFALDDKITKHNWKHTVVNKLSGESEHQELFDSPIEKPNPNQAVLLNKYWGIPPDVVLPYSNSQISILKNLVLKDQCQLINLLGIRGIGKTYLAANLFTTIKQQNNSKFEYFCWRSLETVPNLNSLLDNLLTLILSENGELKVPSFSTNDFQSKITFLLECFNKYPLLLVLDNGEYILDNQIISQEYQDFFRRLGQEFHQSCILILSSEMIPEIKYLDDEGYQKVAILPVEFSREDAKTMIKQELGQQKVENIDQLIDAYQGNPLALKMAIDYIKEVLDRDLEIFLSQKIFVFGGIIELISLQFERLSQEEKQLVQMLATINKSLGFNELILQGKDLNISPRDMMQIIQSLTNKNLLIKEVKNKQVLFSLKPIIQEYIEAVTQEIA